MMQTLQAVVFERIEWATKHGAPAVADAFSEVSPAGSIQWTGKMNEIGTSGMLFICPCGCGEPGALSFDPTDRVHWTWDGDRERPTISPSIQRSTGCRWHGYLIGGFWRQV